MLFSQIIGQEVVKARLLQSAQSGRISHAQLFLGPAGSGALALAVAYAQYIGCSNKQANDSCGACPSCVKMNKLVHPDLHFALPLALSKDVRHTGHVMQEFRESFLNNPYLSLQDWFDTLDAENKQPVIGVEESDEILKRLSLMSYENAYKVMIIWLPEKMNGAASNKLLKILEEPPAQTLFLLVCENEDQLLRTIVSRTQLVKIPKLSATDLLAKLKQGASLRGVVLTDEQLQRTAQLADGNFNKALHLLTNGDAESPLLGSFQLWMRNCLKFDALKVMPFVEELAGMGREYQKTFLQYCLHMMRECLMYRYGNTQLNALTEEEQQFVSKFSKFIHKANLPLFVQEFTTATMHVERNANPKILFTDLSFKVNEWLNMPE